jgi:uncharacterized protein DUF2800
MSAHALASPSSAAMWMACPASITLAEGRVRPSSVYAKEGTAAHKIAEMIIGGNIFPPEKITVEGQEFIVGRDMLKHLNPYIGLVQSYQALGFEVRTETRVGLSAANGLVWGTADCVAHDRNIVAVTDLKYGKGVPVAVDSAQLKIYALGAIETLKLRPMVVALTICQPRLDPKPQTVTMTYEELLGWQYEHLLPALTAIDNGDVTEKTGPHCRWCVRRDECHAFQHQRSGQAADVFNDGPENALDEVENST